jgi:homoserine O-acetyltransferase
VKRPKFRLPLVLCLVVGSSFAQALKIADLGDFPLESGETLLDCRIGYRTFGALNPEKSNAVLFPTWYSGTSQSLSRLIGPGKLVDSTKYYVIAVDALGNGVSSSPSNSPKQPRMKFPKFSIRDMVNTEYRLVKDVLQIPHLRGVMGISMGGYQTFQWMVSYPDFMDRAIPIEGTPLPSSYDHLWLKATSDAIMSDPAWKEGEYTSPPADGLRRMAVIDNLVTQTPGYRDKQTPSHEIGKFLENIEAAFLKFEANNWICQGRALRGHDISRQFGGDMAKAAAAVKARALVIVDTHDHQVMPRPALDFARMINARTLELNSGCGHLAFQCDGTKMSAAITEFLE